MDYRTTLRGLDQLPTFASAADALQANRMDWGVELEPLTTASGLSAPARAVVRTDTRRPLGAVGLRYTPCDNRAATGWLDQYIAHGLRITGAESFRDGERCVMYGLVGDRPQEVKPGDFVALQLVASWSHDGTSSTTGSLRVLRLACSNGLVLAADAGRVFSVRHTRNGDPSSDAIQAQVRHALDRFDTSIAAFRQLADRPVSRVEVREYVRLALTMEPDPVTGDLSGRSRNVLDAVVGHFQSGRGQQINGGGTWWNAYNAVTEHLTHDRGRTIQTRQESLLFGTSARINERALNLALNMSGVA